MDRPITPPEFQAVRVEGEADPNIYGCPARGPGQWTKAQLQKWARQVGAEKVFGEPEDDYTPAGVLARKLAKSGR
jgi:hypothetical protein